MGVDGGTRRTYKRRVSEAGLGMRLGRGRGGRSAWQCRLDTAKGPHAFFIASGCQARTHLVPASPRRGWKYTGTLPLAPVPIDKPQLRSEVGA